MGAIRFVVAALLVCSVPFASAREDCGQAPNEYELGQCVMANFEEADKALNAVYSKLINILENPKYLRTAQRAWVTLRDADCQHVSQAEEGSRVGGVWYRTCAEQKTLARTAELQKYLNDALSGCSQCPPLK